jgi:hypothetical protein
MFGIIRMEIPADLFEASLQRAAELQLVEVVEELLKSINSVDSLTSGEREKE